MTNQQGNIMNNFNFRSYILNTVLPASDIASIEELAAKYAAEYGHNGLTQKAVTSWLQGLPLACDYNTFDIVNLLGYNLSSLSESRISELEKMYWWSLGKACSDLIGLVDSAKKLQARLDRFDLLSECESEVSALFDETLDDTYAEACKGLPVVTSGSELLKTLDPTAYRCGLVDFVGGLEPCDFSAYADLASELNELESELDECNRLYF